MSRSAPAASSLRPRGVSGISPRPCRSCGEQGLRVFLSLGELPLADGLLRADQLDGEEPRFPLDVAFCPACSLVQILEEVSPETLFVDNYLYFSSFSDVLLSHACTFAEQMIEGRRLGPHTLVVEVASNDGYLLKNFAQHGIPVLGIDPAPAQADAAEAAGIPTLREFFSPDVAHRIVDEHGRAALVVANNVMAHTPDLNGFVEGLALLLTDDGVATIENTYVQDLIRDCEFDTIYHEHFSYFSCSAVDALFRRHGLTLLRVDHFPYLQGGTVRWTVGRGGEAHASVADRLAAEAEEGLMEFSYYVEFAARVERLRDDLLERLASLRAGGRSIAAYGAAAKGTTLVNVVGIDGKLVDFVVDRNTHKHGRFIPGVHLPIHDPSLLLSEQPDYLLLLAWNYQDEIIEQQREYRRRGGRFIVPIPAVQIL